MPEMTKIEPSIKNKKAIEVSKKMGKRYSLLDAMMMGRRLGIDWTKEKFTVGDLLVGMHYELEHGKVDPETNVTNDNPKKTAKVAWAHLKERPDYYVQLMKMDPPHKLEKKARAQLNEMVKEATPRWRKEWENLSWSARNRLRDSVASPTNEAARRSRRDFVSQMRNAEDFATSMKASSDKTRQKLQDARVTANAISKKRDMNSGQFASEMQNKSNAFMSGIKAKKPTTSTDEYLGRAISDAKASAIEKSTVHGSPEYKAMRNNENLKATINRKTEAALNKNRAEDSLKAFDRQFGRRKVKIGEPAQGAASKVYSYTEGGAKAYLDKQVAAKNREKLIDVGGKALIGAGIVGAGIGTYKALKKRKENKQRAATPPYNYPQPYPQMMQHTALSLLDNLYFEKTAEDEIADFKEQIPNLILEAKYKPEIKKEETPGGKMTPSKYVQRKNKQRYNA